MGEGWPARGLCDAVAPGSRRTICGGAGGRRMLFILVCAVMIVAAAWPETPVGRMLRRLMVEWPARRLAALDLGRLVPKRASGRIALLLLILLMVGGLVALARSDSLVMLAQGMPEGLAWFATFDIATYLDVIALAVVLGLTVRLRALYGAAKAWVARSAIGRAVRRVGAKRTAARHAPSARRRRPPQTMTSRRGRVLDWLTASLRLSARRAGSPGRSSRRWSRPRRSSGGRAGPDRAGTARRRRW